MIKAPGEILEGSSIQFENKDVLQLDKKSLSQYRGEDVSIIFQDALASLNPTMTVGKQIAETLIKHQHLFRRQALEEAVSILQRVGIPDAANRVYQYPHQFSGGQSQRIARALAVEPEFLVLDEPISALDVSIQAQIVNLLIRLQKEKHLTYLFIAHDLSMVRHISDRIVVMYLGKVVEVAESNELYAHPLHPHTQSLMEAIPIPDPDIEAQNEETRHPLIGEIPAPLNPPQGCRFCSRCRFAKACCFKEAPALQVVKPGHLVACHLVQQLEEQA